VSGETYKNGGDVIIAINDVKIRNGDDLSTYLEKNTFAGQTIQITVLRAARQGTSYIYNQKVTVNLTLGVRPST
jgi:S1-C subfamily serine protease